MQDSLTRVKWNFNNAIYFFIKTGDPKNMQSSFDNIYLYRNFVKWLSIYYKQRETMYIR